MEDNIVQEAMKMPKRKFSRDNTINHNSNEIIRNNFVKKLTQLFKKFNMIDSKDANMDSESIHCAFEQSDQFKNQLALLWTSQD